MTAADDGTRELEEHLRVLIKRLGETETAIQDLVGNQVDAVLDPVRAIPSLLHEAQEALGFRERCQAAVAELGQQAARAPGLSDLLAVVASTVARTLDADYCAVFRLVRSGAWQLVVAAATGWEQPPLGKRLELEPNSQALQALLSGRKEVIQGAVPWGPLLFPNAVSPDSLAEIAIPVLGREGPMGIVGAWGANEKALTGDSLFFLRAVANIVGAAMERELAEASIRELSLPVLQVRERLLLVPLVGSITTERARLLGSHILASIRKKRAVVLVVDLTGVSGLNATVADTFNKVFQSARLLGAKIILTGIDPVTAMRLLEVDIGTKSVQTLGDLQSGIELAERLLNREAA